MITLDSITRLGDSALGGSIGQYLVDRMHNQYVRQECIDLVEYLKEANSSSKTEIALFDYIMKRYVYNLGRTYARHRKNTKRFLKNVWRSITGNDSFLGLTKVDFESDFAAVACYLNSFVHNLIDYLCQQKIINEEQKAVLIEKFCLPDVYAYEQITVPKNHVYSEKGNLINIVWGDIPLDELSRYYAARYDKEKYFYLGNSLLNSDNSKFYYVMFPGGVKGFYEKNF